MREELNKIENRKDDFAVFQFQARREYSYSIEHFTKSGKGIRDTQRRTFEEAVRHGFKGTWQNLLHLLDIPTKKPEQPKALGEY